MVGHTTSLEDIRALTYTLMRWWRQKTGELKTVFALSVTSVSTPGINARNTSLSHRRHQFCQERLWDVLPHLTESFSQIFQCARRVTALPQTTVSCISGMLNWSQIWWHDRPFHNLDILTTEKVQDNTCNVMFGLILLQHHDAPQISNEGQTCWLRPSS